MTQILLFNIDILNNINYNKKLINNFGILMTSHITNIPREMLLNIFTLSDFSISELGILARVCKIFQQITEDNSLWQPLCIKRFKYLRSNNLNFKTLVKVHINLERFQYRETIMVVQNPEQIISIASQNNEVVKLHSSLSPCSYELKSGVQIPSIGNNPRGFNSKSLFFNYSYENQCAKHLFLRKVDIGIIENPLQVIGPFEPHDNIFIFEEWVFGLSSKGLAIVNLNKSVLDPSFECMEMPQATDRILFNDMVTIKELKCKNDSLLLILTNGQLIFVPDLCIDPRHIICITPTIEVNPDNIHFSENIVILLSHELQMETFIINAGKISESFVTNLSTNAPINPNSRTAPKGLSTSDFDGQNLAIGTQNCKLIIINLSEHSRVITIWNAFLNNFLTVKILGPLCITIGDEKFVRIWNISKAKLVKEFLINSISPLKNLYADELKEKEEKDAVLAALSFNGYRLHIVNSVGILRILDFSELQSGPKRSIKKIESSTDLEYSKQSKKPRFSPFLGGPNK